MAMLCAVLIPALMLGVVLALGRYEDLMLPGEGAAPGPDALEAAPVPTSSPVPAETPASSP